MNHSTEPAGPGTTSTTGTGLGEPEQQRAADQELPAEPSGMVEQSRRLSEATHGQGPDHVPTMGDVLHEVSAQDAWSGARMVHGVCMERAACDHGPHCVVQPLHCIRDDACDSWHSCQPCCQPRCKPHVFLPGPTPCAVPAVRPAVRPAA